jgi:hypothetical protein
MYLRQRERISCRQAKHREDTRPTQIIKALRAKVREWVASATASPPVTGRHSAHGGGRVHLSVHVLVHPPRVSLPAIHGMIRRRKKIGNVAQ